MDIFELRDMLDIIDAQLLDAFEERLRIIDDIASIKRASGLPAEDKERESEMNERLLSGLKRYENAPYAEGFIDYLVSISKYRQRSEMNVYLVGMPGCGKSTYGRLLTKWLNRMSIDMDAVIIDRCGMTIPQIFEFEGVKSFREREREALMLLAAKGSMIVSTGGGLPTYSNNSDIIKSSGLCVFLDMPLEELYNADPTYRPLLKDGKEAIIRMYYERMPIYREIADFTVNPLDSDAAEMISAFVKEQLGI